MIKALQQKINLMDQKFIEVFAEMALSSHINSILTEKLDSLSQYTRRSCIIIEGIPVVEGESVNQIEESAKNVLTENLGFNKSTVESEIDKAHGIGPGKQNHQQVIVKFKSHKFQERVYNERKNCQDNSFKFRPSLTKRRENLLFKTRCELEGINNFHFAFTDGHGNIKVKTKQRINNKMFFNIRNMKDIADIMVTLDANDNTVRNFRYDEKDLYPNDENFYEIMFIESKSHGWNR